MTEVEDALKLIDHATGPDATQVEKSAAMVILMSVLCRMVKYRHLPPVLHFLAKSFILIAGPEHMPSNSPITYMEIAQST